MTEVPKTPPGPVAKDALEHQPTELREVLDVLMRLRERYGDVIKCPSSYGHAYLLNQPQDVWTFLTDPRYERTKLLKVALGEGSLSSHGPGWKKQRKLVAPAFVKERIRRFAPMMVAQTHSLMERWAQAAERDEPVDVAADMMRLTLLVVVEAMFSTDIGDRVEEVSVALTHVIEDLGALTGTLWGIPIDFTPARNRVLRQSLRVLDEVCYDIIARRRAGENADADDLLAMLLAARDDETGEGISDKLLRDELVTMLVAGHETTATMLGWAWYLVSQHPAQEAQWHAELDRVLPDRDPTVDDMDDLQYTGWIIREALRLYPPVWTIARRINEAHSLGEYQMDEDVAAFICPFMLHRHPDHWEAPESFDPTRFSEERDAARAKHTWVPFGGGPHLCTGQHFAMLEGYMILATIARRFRLEMVPGHPVIAEPLVTLRSRHGLMMHVRERSA